MPRKQLSPRMTAALKLTFQAEVDISRTDQSVARSGIVESWMVPASTHAALIDRGMLTPMRMVYGGERDNQGCPVRAFGPLVQITAAGCEAIGRSMDEIVAWAWGQAVAEYSARCTSPTPNGGYNLMTELPAIKSDLPCMVLFGPGSRSTHSHLLATGPECNDAWPAIELAPPADNRIADAGQAHDQAVAEYWERTTLAVGNLMTELPKREATRPSLALDYPAAMGGVVTQAHANCCAQYGHVRHLSDGVDVGLCPRCGDPVTVVDEKPSVFEGAAPMLDMQVSAYRYAAEVLDSPRFPEGTEEYDAYQAELKIQLAKFAKGEPPYEYGPIDKTAILSKPIDSLLNSGAQDYTAHDDALLQADLFTGLLDRKALPIAPPAKPRTLLELIKYHGEAFAFSASSDAQRKARDAFAEIERRLNLAAALIPAEVREILDGYR